jgi:crotonobetainyl-CoA:carnitine CoA-transferase CaiB-like acyl-CoA transferase
MTNLRPKAITKLGMDADTLRRHRADLIYAQATAFGRNGPDRDLPSVDPIGLARSGMMLASGFAGDPPTPISVGTGDRATAFMLAYGILGALLGRERFGIVQDVHTSMLGACLVLHG